MGPAAAEVTMESSLDVTLLPGWHRRAPSAECRASGLATAVIVAGWWPISSNALQPIALSPPAPGNRPSSASRSAPTTASNARISVLRRRSLWHSR